MLSQSSRATPLLLDHADEVGSFGQLSQLLVEGGPSLSSGGLKVEGQNMGGCKQACMYVLKL